MKVVFRVDSSQEMASGHVVRCHTLARALRDRGAEISFVTRTQLPGVAELLQASGFAVHWLTLPLRGWGDAEVDDAAASLRLLAQIRPDVVVVDHYGLGKKWETRIKSGVGKVVVIDDLLNRDHDCDVLLDQNYPRRDQRLRDVPPHCQLLLGPFYALLHEAFVAHRKPAARVNTEVRRILLSMGGVDNIDLTSRLVGILAKDTYLHVGVDVVVGSGYRQVSSLRKLAATRPNMRVHTALPNLAAVMAEADVALGGGGITLWERMCLGLPSIVVSLAENQAPICEALSSDGLIEYLGPSISLTDDVVEYKLQEMLSSHEKRAKMSAAGEWLVDGLGTMRVAEAIVPASEDDLSLSQAQPDDAVAYLNWANDPDVRRSAIDQQKITSSTHAEWFSARVKSPTSRMFVLKARGLPIGQVRFDLRDNRSWVDYSLDRCVRGRGWAVRLVNSGIKALPETFFPVQALVRNDNNASKAVFRRLGFDEEIADDGHGPATIFTLTAASEVRLA